MTDVLQTDIQLPCEESPAYSCHWNGLTGCDCCSFTNLIFFRKVHMKHSFICFSAVFQCFQCSVGCKLMPHIVNVLGKLLSDTVTHACFQLLQWPSFHRLLLLLPICFPHFSFFSRHLTDTICLRLTECFHASYKGTCPDILRLVVAHKTVGNKWK